MKITKGTLLRLEREEKNRLEKMQLIELKKKLNSLLAFSEELIKKYKHVVIDSYVELFNQKYGQQVDSKSVQEAISFKYNTNPSLMPEIIFDESKVKFSQDYVDEGRTFNENSYLDFVSNLEILEGKKPDIFITDNPDNEFGEFNPINKITRQGGYASPGDLSLLAKENSITQWDKVKNEIIKKLYKKFNLEA